MGSRRNQSSPPPAETAPPSATHSSWGVFAWPLALLVVVVIAMTLWSMFATAEDGSAAYTYEIVKSYPHDRHAFTQGLVFDDGALLEGTGKEGESTLRKVDLESGRVLESRSLGRKLFGEGITVLGDKIYQLTWKNGICLVYDKTTLRQTGTLRYSGEGWGLTTDGKHLIMSDGSSTLKFLDPNTMRVVGKVSVNNGGRPIGDLNELEYIDGQIYANIWYSDYVARISPKTGQVTAWINLSGLLPASDRPTREHVLNGIAWDKEGGRLFVTGKDWPKLFEIRLVKAK